MGAFILCFADGGGGGLSPLFVNIFINHSPVICKAGGDRGRYLTCLGLPNPKQ
jgi:hypothetical protein